ncbi:hypothetical protein [Sphingomonas sp. Leaf25]|uniref:hypothetical protein n=1 Tax=Sphingomonas sp. Leaf25 TaxID=1735692 RepID=UPI0012E15531|nr:hypothetical protein [Sphingomonas sp. Leaf25]
MRRALSSPSTSLFEQANVQPEELDAAIEDLVWAKASAILRFDHPLLRQVRAATGVNLVQVARRSRNLLIEIEQRSEIGPSWQYREHTPRRCTFSCRGQLPATIETALQGELLEQLVIPAAALQGITIANVAKSGDGWLNIDVAPSWHRF